MYRILMPLLLLGTFAGCTSQDRPAADEAVAVQEVPAPIAAETYGGDDPPLSPEEVERGRMDPGWRNVVRADSLARPEAGPNPERWEAISAESVNTAPMFLPLGGDVAGPSVLRVQVLLDRALFSPGIIDGRWGKNTEKAIYWLQEREGIRATGQVDSVTFARLSELAGAPKRLVREHRLSEDDVSGPFVRIPEDIYARAKMDCMCYESLSEKLSETFHTSPEILERLNPGVALDGLEAGSTIRVPHVRDPDAGRSHEIARLVVSDGGHYLHALDEDDRIVFHFPSTLGSTYDPSPSGDYRVTSITEDPWWHYQPDILAHVDNSKPDANIPPGPNSSVGVVWMALSKPHYGIHGTKAPETIGYATSAGCVRLTNWDALFLARRIEAGVPVEFRDT